MALISASQFKEHFPQLTGAAADSVLDTVIARADALLALYCGYPVPDAGSRTLEDATYTLYPRVSPRHAAALELGLRPIVSVTSVHVDEDWAYGSDTAVDAGDRVLDTQGGRIWLKPTATTAWSRSPRANKVVAVAGYATTPPDLVMIAVATVRHLWDLRNSQGRQQRSTQGHSETYVDATELLPASVRQALGPYILWESRVG